MKQGNRSLPEYRDLFIETYELAEYSNGSIAIAPSMLTFAASFEEVLEAHPRLSPTLPEVTARPPTTEALGIYLRDMDDYVNEMK